MPCPPGVLPPRGRLRVQATSTSISSCPTCPGLEHKPRWQVAQLPKRPKARSRFSRSVGRVIGRTVKLIVPILLIPLLCLVVGVGCGETSSAEGSGHAVGGSSSTESETIPGQLPIGEKPSLPVEPYWFGRNIGDATAFIATESHSDGPSYRYDVYYELPSADGKSGAFPSQVPSPGEIQVISVSLRGSVARQMVETYMITKHYPIVLANGESATFFPNPGPSETGFALATKTTFVSVLGPAVTSLDENAREDLAVRLRRL